MLTMSEAKVEGMTFVLRGEIPPTRWHLSYAVRFLLRGDIPCRLTG